MSSPRVYVIVVVFSRFSGCVLISDMIFAVFELYIVYMVSVARYVIHQYSNYVAAI